MLENNGREDLMPAAQLVAEQADFMQETSGSLQRIVAGGYER